MKQENGFLKPETILDQLEIKPDIVAADFGCGHGYFTIPLAKRASQGKVYALDVVKGALEAVNSQAKLAGVSNIETIRANLEVLGGSKLNDRSVDFVLMRNILYQSQEKSKILKEAKRVLKPEGRLAVIEWLADSSLAPKEGWLISKEEVRQLLEAEGLVFERGLVLDNHHYGLIFKKPSSTTVVDVN